MAELNSFTNAVVRFENLGIHGLLAEIMTFRQQLTMRTELKSLSGWSDSFQRFLEKNLENLRNTVENIAINEDVLTQEELEDKASDTTKGLEDDYNSRALNADDILMFTTVPRDVIWDLTGNDPDIPQLNQDNCPNVYMRLFVKLLDELFVQATRLDSRSQRQSITKYEAAMLVAVLNELYTICQRKGGEENRMDIPVGVLPSTEPSTFNSNRNLTTGGGTPS